MTVEIIPDTPPSTIPILIIGAGPVGLSLAIELRLQGISVVVIEQTPQILDGHPKGRSNDMRTVEHYRRWGVSNTLRKLSWQTRNPHQELIINQTLTTTPIGRFPLRYGRHEDETRDLVAEPSFSVPQPVTMRVLQERAKELGALVFRGWEAVGIRQDEENVTTDLRLSVGISHRVVSDYVVGCDGPSSLVRKTAGITRSGIGSLGRFWTYVVRSEGYRIGDLVKSPGYEALGMLMILNSQSSSIISIPDDEGWGFGIYVPGEEQEPSDEEIHSRAQALLGATVPIEVISRSSYQLRTRVSDHYRKGRLFIAGDAAHICPPTGGHNMNVGIEDAVNLAWKLAAVLNGWGGEGLLDSYETERWAVGKAVSETAIKNSFSMAEAEKQFRTIEESDRDISLSQKGKLAFELTYPQWNTHGVVLDQRYEASRVIIRDGWEDVPPWSPTEYWNQARPGHRAPHFWLPDGTALKDHFGRAFTLLDTGASEELVEGLGAAARKADVSLAHFRVPGDIIRERYPAKLTLIRPDQYICWQGDYYDNPDAIFSQTRGDTHNQESYSAKL